MAKGIFTVLALSCLFAVGAYTQVDKPLDPQTQEMIKRAEEAGRPGPAHERLQPFVGEWTAKSWMWMKPGDQPQESSGASRFSWVLDGRFLQQNFSGDWAGKTFQGLGYVGYDNIKKEYTNLWMDSMSTSQASARGTYDAATNTLKDQGTFSCPITGIKDRWFRSEWKLPEGNVSRYTMYNKDETGKEFKAMEIVYTRVK